MSNTTQTSARKRIEALLDDKSFVEIGGLIKARNTDFNMTTVDTPADGVITGYGTIDGSLVYVYSQDVTVLSGSIGEMHAKKIVNIYDMAIKMGAPVVGLLDCAGLRLQEATDALNAVGEIYQKQVMASGVVPQIMAVFGACGGGLALMPGLTDFTFMEEKNGKLFVNSPNALDGNFEAKNNTSGAAFQSAEAGLVDFVGDEATILADIRKLITVLPSNNEDEAIEECQDDLNRGCDGLTANDPDYVISSISDGNLFIEVKKNFAPSMVTGFIKLNGATVGVVANKAIDAGNVLTADGCDKAADFVKLCDAFSIPVLSLTNVKGYLATVENEKSIAKAAARLTYAFCDATVPKVNLITGEAYGSAYVTMNSKAIGADVTYAWPDAVIGTMDAGMAAKIIYADKPEVIGEKTTEYATLQNNVVSAAQRGYVDSIVEPVDTRKYIIGAFEMLYSKSVDTVAKKHGTV